MKFGLDLITGKKIEPKSGQKAICSCCKLPLIPKCGKIKVHHWAHKNDFNCDSWWEPETEWHRQWKNKFPNDWQEVVKFDKEANKHIADVFNPKIDLVIEFQNSSIAIDEIRARETFYKKMIWVVNADKYDIAIMGLDDYSHYNVTKLAKEVTNKLKTKASNIRHEIKDILKNFGNPGKEEATEKLDKMKELDKLLMTSLMEIESVKHSTKLSLFSKYIENIEYYVKENKSRQLNTKYIQYSWRHRSKVWSGASQPVFLDLGDRLILIKNSFIALTVDKEMFAKKYSLN